MATRTGFSSRRLQQLASLLSSASLAVLTGCGAKVVDLGANHEGSGPVYSKSISVAQPDAGASAAHDPVRIVDREPNGCGNGRSMGMYTVDAGNLYWMLPNTETSYTLYTCVTEHCADSVKELTTGTGGTDCRQVVPKNSMQIDDDQIYWMYPEMNSPLTDLLVASKTVASKSTVVSFPFVQWAPPAYVVSEGVLYGATAESTLVQCQANDCESTRTRYDLVPPDDQVTIAPTMIGLDENYLYLAPHLSGVPSASPTRLLRVAKDPHAPLEILLSTWPTAAGDFAVHGDSIYWVEYASMGQLLSCPKTGCVDRKPSVITSGLENPTGLAADDDYLYILESPQFRDGNSINITRSGRILRCPLSGCAEPTVLYTSTTENWMDQLMVDDRFVYFAGGDCPPYSKWFASCGFITAIPK